MPFLFGFAVREIYGPAWGLGELAVLAVWVAALMLNRKRLQRAWAHPALMFGTLAVGMSAILFAGLALFLAGLAVFHVPALASLVIGVLAGPALIARDWKSQLQRWQDLRETE